MNLTAGYVARACLRAWCVEPASSFWYVKARRWRRLVALLELVAASFDFGFLDSPKNESRDSKINLGGAESPLFPPEVAVHLVKLACEMPDKLGVSLSLWDCRELARKLESDGIVETISADTVRRILDHHHLKPWRCHMWLGTKTPRDEAFRAIIRQICDLYTRKLGFNEMVLCLDEKTSLQPRTRKEPTKPAKSKKPVLVEHEYERKGALNLFAAFDTRTGQVYGRCFRRKRQIELIAFLNYLDVFIPAHITKVHIVCDNLRVHKGKKVLQWLSKHPRFIFNFTPVHCSWMNQVEQWFSILQRKRLKIADFDSIDDLRDKLYGYIDHWNQKAHPFNWTTKSVAKIMAKTEPLKEAA
jgi:transposase